MPLLLLGASARSAAFSALRAGVRPMAADLFADFDLTLACPAFRIDPACYPSGLATFADGLPPTPWLYTGALENRPDLVDAIARRHPLRGNPGSTLKAVRDPVAVAALLRSEDLAAPEAVLDPGGLPVDGSWLAKPTASAGGHGIHRWFGGLARPSFYYQRRMTGLSLAAIFVGREGAGRLVGITRQFVSRFAYRGSLGPWPVADEVAAEVARIGDRLASAFGLVGIFGVDLILRDGRAWVIEVNPRYTASVEVLEWAAGRSVLADHLAACGEDVPTRPHPRAPGRFVAKAILRANCPAVWPGAAGLGPFDPDHFPEIADVPHPGTRFRTGEPVLTALASGSTPASCRRQLASRLKTWRRWLYRDR